MTPETRLNHSLPLLLGTIEAGNQPQRGCAMMTMPIESQEGFPRVAAKARQPWALLRNRFAVRST
jgi:hypothetical protein